MSDWKEKDWLWNMPDDQLNEKYRALTMKYVNSYCTLSPQKQVELAKQLAMYRQVVQYRSSVVGS